MIVKNLAEVPCGAMPGYENIRKQIVLGPDDGSNEIILRYFSLDSGVSTPHHAHGFPHLVKIEAGTGVVVNESGLERKVQQGDYVFISDNEIHHFTNTGVEVFDFICIVPRRGEA